MPKDNRGVIQLLVIAIVLVIISGLTIFSNLNSARELVDQNPNVLGVVYEQDPTKLSMQDEFKQKVDELLQFAHSLVFTR